MKIRNGFVSNSSSSNFIVVFDKKPKDKDDLKKRLFPDRDVFQSPYSEKTWPIANVVATIWEDIKGQRPNNKKAILDAINHGYYEGHPDFHFDSVDQKTSVRWQKAWDDGANKLAKKFYLENKFVYVFSFSDNEGDYQSALEHGDTFENIKHIRISCH
jgi:hypothetical protein